MCHTGCIVAAVASACGDAIQVVVKSLVGDAIAIVVNPLATFSGTVTDGKIQCPCICHGKL